MRPIHRIFPVTLSIGALLSIPANSYQPVLPTPTFAGLRAAQVELEAFPTPNPWNPSEILRRLSGDSGICGWVEGNSSRSLHTGIASKAWERRV